MPPKKLRKHPALSKNLAACSAPAHCPIVALGASAGGLEVFGQFFDRMPPDTGFAFVVVQHLDPSHDTLMPELLSKHTTMKVMRVENGMNCSQWPFANGKLHVRC
jgi:chemotaxis response regulator CheB